MSYFPAFQNKDGVFVRVSRNVKGSPLWVRFEDLPKHTPRDAKKTPERAARSAFDYVGKHLDVTAATFGFLDESGCFRSIFKNSDTRYFLDCRVPRSPLYFNDFLTAKANAKPGDRVIERRTGHVWRKTTRPEDVRVAEFVRRRVLEAERHGILIHVPDWRLETTRKFAGEECDGLLGGVAVHVKWAGVNLLRWQLATERTEQRARQEGKSGAFLQSLVLEEIRGERRKQDAKWGQQNHLSVRGVTPYQRATHYGLPLEEVAKSRCDARAKEGTVTWADIAVEELAEAVAAGDGKARRAELVQLAAVVVAWIEAIDRRPCFKAATTSAAPNGGECGVEKRIPGRVLQCTKLAGHGGPHEAPGAPPYYLPSPRVFFGSSGAPPVAVSGRRIPPAATCAGVVAEEIAAEVEDKDRRYGRAVLRGVEVLKILYPSAIRPDQYADAFLTLRLFEKRSRIASAQDDDAEDARRDSLGYCLVDVVQHRNR